MLNNWFDELFLWSNTVRCAVYPTIFCKNSVKLTFPLKSYTVNQFDEKFLQWGKFSEITTLWVSIIFHFSTLCKFSWISFLRIQSKTSVKSTFRLTYLLISLVIMHTTKLVSRNSFTFNFTLTATAITIFF